MAFFGITSLGYQDPFASRKLSSPPETPADRERLTTVQVPFTGTVLHSAGGYDSSTTAGVKANGRGPSESTKQASTSYAHNGSQQKFKEMLKRNQTPRAPNQLYRVPLTDNQQYGWRIEQKEPWMNVSHFPCKNSEITKFASEMSVTDRKFSLF